MAHDVVSAADILFSGHCSAQIGFAYGHLVRNTQPDGGESGDGSSP